MEKRTTKQNRALHLYLKMLADELNAAGLDQRVVLKPEVDIPWDEKATKERLWKPIQRALLMKTSTTNLETHEVGLIFEVLNRHLGEKFGLHVPFPNEEDTKIKDLHT